MKLHLDGIARPDARDVRRDRKLVVVGQIGKVVVPPPASAAPNGIEHNMVVAAAAKTQIALHLGGNGDQSVLGPMDHRVKRGEGLGQV